MFKELFQALEAEKVKYLLVGGIAVNLYGIERATADVDLVVSLDEENLRNFIRAVKKIDLRPRVPVPVEDLLDKEKRKAWAKEKGMLVFSLQHPQKPFFLLDVFIDFPFDFNEVYERRNKMKFGEIIVDVASVEDLIRMKEKSSRLQDKTDVFYLRKILNGWEDEE